MLRGIHSRFDLEPLRALLEGDFVFFADGDGDGGSGGSGGSGGGSSQEDDDHGDGDDDDGAGSGDGDDDTGDDDDGESPAVRRANRQAAKARVQLKEERQKREALEARLAKLEAGGGDGDDSEKSKQAEQKAREAEERAAKAERQLLRRDNEATITAVAKRLGFSDPDVIVSMVESGRVDDLDPDEELDREDVKLALRDLKRAKPHLLGDGSSTRSDEDRRTGGGTGPARSKSRTANAEIDKLPLKDRAHARLTRAFTSK